MGGHGKGIDSPGGEANGSKGKEELLKQKELVWNQFKAKREQTNATAEKRYRVKESVWSEGK